jgi:hypothetical protein
MIYADPSFLFSFYAWDQNYTEATGAAAVDVWHVAAAILQQADTLWTFDEEQRETALRSGKFKRVPKLKP